MARPSKTDQEIGHIRDYWTELRTIEAEYHGMVTVFVNCTTRPGVLVFRMIFTPLMEGQPNALGTTTLEFLYPNIEQSTLAGFLWRKAITLGRLVAEDAEQQRDRLIKRG